MNLDETDVGNATLSLLKGFPLKRLSLSKLRITKEGLASLLKLRQLESLTLWIQNEESAALQEKYPTLKVVSKSRRIKKITSSKAEYRNAISACFGKGYTLKNTELLFEFSYVDSVFKISKWSANGVDEDIQNCVRQWVQNLVPGKAFREITSYTRNVVEVKEGIVKLVLHYKFTVVQSLSWSEISAVMKKHKNVFLNCAEKSGNKRFKGKKTMRFSVQSSGKVKSVKVLQAQPGDRVLESCLIKELGELRFPKPDGPAMVKYPLVF